MLSRRRSQSLPNVVFALLLGAGVLVGGLPGSAVAQSATEKVRLDMPAQDLSTSLTQFGRETRTEIVFAPDAVREKKAVAIKGEFERDQALKLLLEGTGLSYRTTPQGAIVVEPVKTVAGATAGALSPVNAITGDDGTRGADEASKDNQGSERSSGSLETLEEIVVTAQKRVERLQDVPVPVTAISGNALAEQNQLRLQDYYTRIPGLSVTPNVLSSTSLSIRGITTGGFSDPTVGVVVDDVPYGASTFNGGGLVVPDIDPGDLARVEVLRGPQGTLYGASSMGGLLKFVTVDPSTTAYSGRVQAGTSSVYNGDKLGYNLRGSVNVPLSDTWAMRISGFTRQDPGYIDNPVLHINGLNKSEIDGGRLSALWQPSETVSLKLSALFQESKADGSSDVDNSNAAGIAAGYSGPPLGDLQQNYARGVGGYDRHIQAYSAILAAKLGGIDFAAISGYNINSFTDSWDFSYALGGLAQSGAPGTGFDGFGVSGAPVFSDNKTKKFTQEIRFSGPIGQGFDWLFGAFYTHENSQYVQNLLGINPTTGVVVGNGLNSSQPTTFTEYAAFGDITFHMTDRFDVQFGGRESQNKQTSTVTQIGPFVPAIDGAPSPYVIPETDSKANAFTYLVTPRFKVSPDLMVYARLASGYRAGGPNTSPVSAGTPREYQPDKTQNYEIGIKGNALNRMLSFDASLYHIDWKDIQVSLVDRQTQQGYTANGSRAKSEGVELSGELRPLTGLTIAAWVVWDKAELTEAFPSNSAVQSPVYGVSGDRLPYSSRFSGNLSVEQGFPLRGSITGFVGGSVSYVGAREGVFMATPERQVFPAYAKADLRAGAQYVSWTANFFVTNVADKRGLLTGGLGAFPPFGFNYIQPRTVGFSLARTF